MAAFSEHGMSLEYVVEHGTITVQAQTEFARGESNADGAIDLSDPVHVLGHLFLAEPAPAYLKTADPYDGGLVDISDAICILKWLFIGGRSPAHPHPAYAVDLTADDLTCLAFEPCA